MIIKPYAHYEEFEILPLYRAVGWSNYFHHPEMLQRAYENSLCVLGAYENDELIGIIRAVGDGYSIVFIQDIIIHPQYQRRGIGTKLVKALLKQYDNVYQIQLMTDDTEKNKAFYKSIGFWTMDEFGCCGFLRV